MASQADKPAAPVTEAVTTKHPDKHDEIQVGHLEHGDMKARSSLFETYTQINGDAEDASMGDRRLGRYTLRQIRRHLAQALSS
ncbi:hypothetical protein NW762_001341 [Fusarium torreyae]|uniref:Uncharacterized protein n=1 Tax=Fusarium torreyae TaxID=1237075 RepID=A0A9W8VJT5_9HYPO|nr:hypothetical protein NW762_001341 [Fusarium torreyae]